MKRLLPLVMGVLCLVLCVPKASGLETSASAALLMDAASGRVLYEKNAHERRLIASTTKLMTALVALESGCSLTEEVTVDPAWAGVEGSSIYLQAGETVTLEELLYGMLLRSGNDAAMAVAGCCGGSAETFVAWMNEKAEELGMADSHFSNPSGLDGEAHYSTAYDMALLGRACLEEDTLREIMSTRSARFGTRVFTNHNKLLQRYEGCIGMKTGYTEKAGRTLVSAAERDGLTLICVTLNAPNDWADHAALLDYGFETYQAELALEEGTVLGYLPVSGSLVPACPVVAEESVLLCVKPEERVQWELEVTSSSLEGPVKAGTRVGEGVARWNGEELARVPLVTGADCPRNELDQVPFWRRILGIS